MTELLLRSRGDILIVQLQIFEPYNIMYVLISYFLFPLFCTYKLMNMFLFADVEKKMVPNLKQIQKEIKGLYLLSRFVFITEKSSTLWL
jgi:hypothetical protein